MSGPWSDLTPVQLQQVHEAAGEAKRRRHALAGLTSVPQILDALNDYERRHSPEAMAYDPENIWRDVIQHLPGFDAEQTYQLTDCDRFMLTDGTVIRWQSGRSPLWQVDPEEAAG